MRLGSLVPVLLAFSAALPVSGAEPAPAAPQEQAASAPTAQDLAPLTALLSRAEQAGLPPGTGEILDGSVVRTQRMENGATWLTEIPCFAIRDAAGRVWVDGALPIPEVSGVEQTWRPWVAGVPAESTAMMRFSEPIILARLAQRGDAAAWARLGGFHVHREGSLPLGAMSGTQAVWWRSSARADEMLALDRTEALAHALVLWALQRLSDAPPAGDAALTELIAAVAPPRLAAWAAGEAARRREARTAPATLPFIPDTADEATLVAALADLRPLALPGADFTNFTAITPCVRIADAARTELWQRWLVDPATLAHQGGGLWMLPVFGPRIVPEPAAAETVALLQARILAPGPGTRAERLAGLLVEGPVELLLAALGDPYALPSYDGQTDPAPRTEFRRAVAVELARAWAATVPPLTPKQQLVIVRFFGQEPSMIPLFDRWAWTPAAARAHALYDEQHGRPERMDAQVIADLDAAPRLGDTVLDPLTPWVAKPTAARLDRLLALVADPSTAIAVHTWSSMFARRVRDSRVPAPPALAPVLLARLLADERPLTGSAISAAAADLIDQEVEEGAYISRSLRDKLTGRTPLVPDALPAGTRVCDVALHRCWRSLNEFAATPDVEALYEGHTTGFDLRDPLPLRESARLALRRLLVPYVRRTAEALQWTPPSDMLDVPAEPPLVSTEEAADLQAVLAEGMTLGFPDLAHAVVRAGVLPGPDPEQRIHIQLADGRWLRGGDGAPVAVAAELPVAELAEPRQQGGYGLPREMTERLPSLAPRLGKTRAWRMSLMYQETGWSDYAIIARWAATPGRNEPLDTAFLTVLALPAENPRLRPVESTDLDFGRDPTNPPPVTDSLVGLLRGRLSRWFLARAADASTRRDAAEARRWATAALAILPEADRGYWQAPIERVVTRADIPTKPAADADLAARLAAWETNGDPLGGPHVPDGDDALVALLGDPRPARIVRIELNLAVGEIALLVLAGRWHGDPRWLVGRPDCTIGTAEVLRDDGTAIRAWWAAHHADSEADRAAALMTGAPLVALASRGVYGAFPRSAAPAIGAALGKRFATGIRLPEGTDQSRVTQVLPALLWYARDLDTAGWPADSVHRQVRRILAVAAGTEGTEGAAAALLAGEVGLIEDNQRGGPRAWELSGVLQPQRNLGLIVYQPTRAHRALLREQRAGDLGRPVPALLAALAGGAEYPVLGDYGPSRAWRERDARTPALAADLAAEAAEDARPLPAELRAKVGEWARNLTAYELPDPSGCADLRVCDWVAARVLDRPGEVDAVLPADAPKAAAFLALPIVERDVRLVPLRKALHEAATVAAQASGLEAAPPSGF